MRLFPKQWCLPLSLSFVCKPCFPFLHRLCMLKSCFAPELAAPHHQGSQAKSRGTPTLAVVAARGRLWVCTLVTASPPSLPLPPSYYQSGFVRKDKELVLESPELTNDGLANMMVWTFLTSKNEGLLEPFKKMQSWFIQNTLGAKRWKAVELKHDKRRTKVKGCLFASCLLVWQRLTRHAACARACR